MKKLIIIYLLIPFISNTFGQSPNRPESIIWDSAHQRYLISNVGDGAILSYYPDEDRYSYFDQTHTVGPKGLAIYNNTLYVSDNAFINGFNLDTGQRVFNTNVGTGWINDLTVDQEGMLYTGDANTGIIYKINTSNRNVEEWLSGFEDINGLHVDQENNRLIAVFYMLDPPIIAFDLDTKESTILINKTYSNCDGITVDNCGKYYISSQGSSHVFCYDKDFSGDASIFVTDLVTPADIYYNQELDVLCIPEIDNLQIVFVDAFRTCLQPLLNQPQNLQNDVSCDNISFSWEPIAKADYYRFEIANDLEFRDIILVDGTGTPDYQLDHLDPQSEYYWRVNAYKQNQHTEYSETWSFKTAGGSSVNQQEFKDHVSLYPNPANNLVTLQWGHQVPEHIQFYNSCGKLVQELKTFVTGDYSSQTIHIEKLHPGCYYCKIIFMGSSQKVEKLLVK